MLPALGSPEPAAPERKVIPGPRPPMAPAASGGAAPTVLRPRRRRTRRFVAALLLLAAVAAGVTVWRRAQTPLVVRYVTVPVTRGAVTRTVTATGSANPVITVQVGTYVSGVIQELYCDYNTRVRKGQLCAKIDPRPYQTIVEQDKANLATARAQLAKDQTNLAYAKLTFERTSGLRERGIVSQDAFDAAKSTSDQAAAQVDLDRANIAQHEAALKAAEINLGYTDIVSPVNGTVVTRTVTMGQTVAASFQTPTLFLIATDLTKMQVDANVSESDIGGVREGNAASFTVEAFPSRVFEGRVTQVRQSPQTVQNVVTYDVVISVPNPDLALKPGMTATVAIVVDRRSNVLRVPDSALRYTPGGPVASGAGAATGARGMPGATAQVWVLRNGHPSSIPVGVGLDDDVNTEIVAGNLAVGDQVITSEQTSGGTASLRVPLFRL